MNLEQTTTKIGETWGIASPLPREHIPKRSRPKDQRFLRIREEIKRVGVFSKTQELEFERARDSRGSRTGLDARESQLRTRSLLSIKCAKNEIENPLHKAQNQGIESNQKPRGHEEDRASFPNQIPYKVSTIHGQNQLKREEQREGDAGAAAWRNRESTNRLQKPQLT